MRALVALLSMLSAANAAVELDGNFHYVQSFADTPSMSITGTVSISVWVTKRAGINISAGLVEKGRNGDNTKDDYFIRNNADQYDFFYQSPDSTLQVWRTTATFTTTNSPQHIAATFTYGNASSIAFYVNGVAQAGSWIAGTGTAIGLTNSQIARVGATVSALWWGTIDEVAIWNTILSNGEIQNLYKSRMKYMPLQVQPGSLIMYCPMDDRPDFYNTYSAGFKFIDRGKGNNSMRDGGNGPNNPVKRATSWFSYQPNE